MGDLQTRPFSKNYSGLINQSVIAIGITVLCVGSQELMRRKRRGKRIMDNLKLGSRESWEFGYLYQARSWARIPSPRVPLGWPLSWIPQVIRFPEEEMCRIRGVDATLYIRFLRGCFWFALLHTFTTFPILFPIHVHFSGDEISPKSMTRASISSLVQTANGLDLLWIHICLLFWITLSWIATLLWICHGAFRLRAQNTQEALQRKEHNEKAMDYHPHPHPQYGFTEIPALANGHPNSGLALRTIMVSNVLPQLRDEKELKEYFEYYMSRKIERPAMGVNTTTEPGFINKSLAFIFNRAKRLPVNIPISPLAGKTSTDKSPNPSMVPVIERVVIVRKMTELASLLERREDILRLLETAHIKLAKKSLMAVKGAMDLKAADKSFSRVNSRAAVVAKQRRAPADVEAAGSGHEETLSEQDRMKLLIDTLGPFVEEFNLRPQKTKRVNANGFRKLRMEGSIDSDAEEMVQHTPISANATQSGGPKTIWDALLSLPRHTLDAYQPLVNLSHLFRGKTVPAIDYYTAKLNLLSSLITENRAKHVSEYSPVSTAFVTFADPEDARRACKYLTVHPNNPLACMVRMAPQYQDLDWYRVMKSSYDVEFVKDWVVSLGVWGFTVFWLFPVSLLVGLVSIQNISAFWPQLKAYLDKHPWESEVIQSFLPTLLVALLALLIPLVLLLIAKKAHNIMTLSALHDRIMTRYYKFLVVNVLVFFCVGTAAVQSVLQSFNPLAATPDVIKVVADSFPSAGPFYVGWLIFTLAMHGGFEIVLLGLPLIMYPSTRSQVTPRKRAVGVRPRTFNFYYWLPTHVLVIHVLLLFAVLNPFVLPFGAIYFFIETGVIKNQLIHVYAKNYEGNGKLILIRILRYSLDGLVLTQAVFLAYMVVLKKEVNVGLAGFLIVFTVLVKIFMTRVCRAQFEHDDIYEAHAICGELQQESAAQEPGMEDIISSSPSRSARMAWMPDWVSWSYRTLRHRPPIRRRPNPFRDDEQTFSRIVSLEPVKPRVDTAVQQPDQNQSGSNTPVFPSPEPRGPSHLNSITEPWQDDLQSGPVVLHPPPPAWDDQTTVDLPYDNPFYTRPVSNYLWLPRNPCGVLDLDDTVDLKSSITIEHSAAPLGTWTGLTTVESPMPLSIRSNSSATSLPQRSGELPVPEHAIDGTEEIDLPQIIAKRAAAKDDVEEVQTIRRPSQYRRRYSSGRSHNSNASSVRGRRPSMLSPPGRRTSTGSPSRRLPNTFRSFSDGTQPAFRRSSSHISLSPSSPSLHLPRAPSPTEETGLRPDAHAQVDFVAENTSLSQLSMERPRLRRAQNITAHQAIVREVVAEEQEAMVHRLQEEEAEAQKATANRSWWWSWAFKKRTE